MAIQIVGSITEQVSPASTSVNLLNSNHTSTSDTDLMLCCVAIEGAETLDSGDEVAFDLSGGNVNLANISDSGNTGDNSDVQCSVWGMISPGAVTDAQTSIRISPGTANQIAVVWINLSGTNTTSLAAATNDIDTYSDTSGSGSTTVLSSGGSTGNGLIAWGAAQNNSMAPSAADNSFIEQVDSVTAATSSDFAYNLSTLLAGAPSACTITWNTTNENAGNLIEVVPATSSAFLPGFTGIGRGILRGVGRGT